MHRLISSAKTTHWQRSLQVTPSRHRSARSPINRRSDGQAAAQERANWSSAAHHLSRCIGSQAGALRSCVYFTARNNGHAHDAVRIFVSFPVMSRPMLSLRSGNHAGRKTRQTGAIGLVFDPIGMGCTRESQSAGFNDSFIPVFSCSRSA